VWWDALGNYLTGLGYGGPDGSDLDRWWTGAARRIHLVGKGVIRFHAVYWPAILLSAREALPTDILVHDYLTAGGRKISKSGGAGADPHDLVARYGTDAVRWWLLREVPRSGDTDFTPERLVSRANDELANGIGNLVNRVVTMIHRYRDGYAPTARGEQPGEAKQPGETEQPEETTALGAAIVAADAAIGGALADYAFRPATEAVWRVAVEANRCIEVARPWELARAERGGAARGDLDAVLGALLRACQAIGERLRPFLPDAAARVARQCEPGPDGRLPDAVPVLPRIEGLDPA
jgi:methionyl-tRNA synthetase